MIKRCYYCYQENLKGHFHEVTKTPGRLKGHPIFVHNQSSLKCQILYPDLSCHVMQCEIGICSLEPQVEKMKH